MSSPKTVLITGCSVGGIGHALALEFKAKGFRVFATARNPKSMGDLSEKGIETLVLDVTKEESIREARDKVAELTGGKLNVLVNNAGATYPVPSTDIEVAEAKKLFDVNLFGVMAMVKEFVHLLIASQDGRILNISSVAGTINLPFGSVYNATKAALNSYGDTLRVELAPFNIQVTSIVTGGVKSNIARTDLSLPADSLYQPIADFYDYRLKSTSENSNATPTEEYARRVVQEALKSKQKIWLWTAASSTMVWFLVTFLPRRVVDNIMSSRFGLSELAKKFRAKKKAD
ncbi:NAD(P)-binding protein [Dentipellis sp. KUC8613]|nr:NAD(P)-binding protein [Dentipellis sp. KUC8613]